MTSKSFLKLALEKITTRKNCKWHFIFVYEHENGQWLSGHHHSSLKPKSH
jgi:hypothetical protein